MKHERTRPLRVGFGVVMLCGLLAGLALAGDLNPPPGVVTPTMKTLVEVEPRIALDPDEAPIVINATGSYYLTGNITALVAGTNAITINADHVTLDLNGFAIRGSEVAFFQHGVAIASSAENARVMNGSIIGCAGEGVSGSSSVGASATNLRVHASGGNGIHLGVGARVRECTATGNNDGIRVGNASAVHDCVVSDNRASGVTIVGTGAILGCSAVGNDGAGLATGFAGVISNCGARLNEVGIYGGSGSQVTGCSVYHSEAEGVRVDDNARVADTASSNNNGHGIETGTGAAVERCTTNDNDLNGIDTGVDSRVTDCNASSNANHGIEILTNSTASGNHCVGNGSAIANGAGIRAFGTDSRIDLNNCTGNDIGFLIELGGNLVARNSASGNATNFSIVGGNDVGTIQASPVGAGAWDNFEF